MMNRREFLFAASVSSGFMLAGCPSFTTIEDDLDAWVPLGLDAFDGVLALFDPPLAAVLLPVTNLVEAGLKAIEQAISDWEAADALQKPGLLGGIIAGIQAAEEDIGNFLAAVNVSAPALLLPAKALANIILGILQYFANRLSGAASTASGTVTVKSGSFQVEPLNLTHGQFRAKFDAKADSLGHPGAHGRWGAHKKKKKK